MIRPGRNHQTRICSGLEEVWWKGFLEPARQEKQRRGLIPQNWHRTNSNEKPRFHPPFPYCLASRKATHRPTRENINRPDFMCDRLQRMHGFHKNKFPRGRSVPRLVNAIANKPGGCEGLPVAKKRLFRARVSMGKQRHRMRSRTGRNELKRRRVSGERHFFDVNARLDPM